MKKILLVFCLIFFTTKIFAQQFSQYNTGTLYDSFENPAQKAFITDSSKLYATNALIPNFNANFFLSGNAQSTLKNRAFFNRYDNSLLAIGQSKYNHLDVNANVYIIMFKMFRSFNGDTEFGFSWQTKAEGKGLISDESFALLNGTQSFSNQSYTNIFNDNYYFQTYHQFSLTYKEKFNKQFTFGIKLSGLLGIEYRSLNITHSDITFDQAADSALLSLKGRDNVSYIPGNHVIARDYLPTFRNPGASISLGTMYRTEDNFTLQANIKDLGFIHWSNLSRSYNVNGSAGIQGLSSPAREDSIYNKVTYIVHNVASRDVILGSFVTPIDGRAEVSANRSYWIDEDRLYKYSPTLIVSKELFYPGFTAALVNPVQYKNFIGTVTATYDDLKIFNVGLQLMIKSPNFECFIGSDRLIQSASLLMQADGKNQTVINQNSAYSGADFFLGFSIKFGPVAEHPMNSSTMVTGEKGFIGRLIGRLFKTYE